MAVALRAGGRPGGPRPPAPDFELESHTGEQVRLSSFRGEKSVVLFFMRAYT